MELLNTPDQVLDGYLSTKEMADQINKSERTLARWRDLGIGPPYSLVGQTPIYSIAGGRESWARGSSLSPAVFTPTPARSTFVPAIISPTSHPRNSRKLRPTISSASSRAPAASSRRTVIRCGRCDRAGRRRVSRLIEQHRGAKSLPDLRTELAQGCDHACGHDFDRCDVFFAQLASDVTINRPPFLKSPLASWSRPAS